MNKLKTITVNRLHKMLGKVIANGHGRAPVCIDKQTFSSNLESDGCCILQVDGVEILWINLADDDGGIAMNADGTERGRTTVVLYGWGHEPNGQEISP